MRRGIPATIATAMALLVSAAAFSQANPGPSPAKDSTFTNQTAVLLLDQLGTGLADHNQNKVLGVFDIDKMSGGPLFRQQLRAFLAQTGNVRIHFNIVQVSMEGGKGIVEADWQMDAEVREAITAPLRKQARLRFVAENTRAGWKLTDVQPRAFFSAQ